MNIARILYPVKVLGPGNRIGIWLSGCPRRCKGCSNPELWEWRSEFELSVSEVRKLIMKIAAASSVDGFTISGGEPMVQAEELAGLVDCLKTVSGDILIYTGYTYTSSRIWAIRRLCFLTACKAFITHVKTAILRLLPN
ncbi:MAG: radical SAM protein [Clostridiales Family XIII bacterium]|jgi:anaerobic ribonucleoside-triphosphate reductase activating protein|nr:radical SAM protein [Clostridiales Family XIII bacterium]